MMKSAFSLTVCSSSSTHFPSSVCRGREGGREGREREGQGEGGREGEGEGGREGKGGRGVERRGEGIRDIAAYGRGSGVSLPAPSCRT